MCIDWPCLIVIASGVLLIGGNVGESRCLNQHHLELPLKDVLAIVITNPLSTINNLEISILNLRTRLTWTGNVNLLRCHICERDRLNALGLLDDCDAGGTTAAGMEGGVDGAAIDGSVVGSTGCGRQ